MLIAQVYGGHNFLNSQHMLIIISGSEIIEYRLHVRHVKLCGCKDELFQLSNEHMLCANIVLGSKYRKTYYSHYSFKYLLLID